MHLGSVSLRLRGLHLTEQGQEPLVQRDFLGPRLVRVFELATHGQVRPAVSSGQRGLSILAPVARRHLFELLAVDLLGGDAHDVPRGLRAKSRGSRAVL